MSTTFRILAVVVLLALISGGCGTGGTGSGNVQTQTRAVPPFDSIDFSSAGTVTIEQTGTDSLQVQADDNIQPLLTSEVKGTTLQLGVQPGPGVGKGSNINYRVTVRQLRGVVLSGAGNIDAMRIDTPDLSLANSGAGRLAVSGRAERQNIDLVGLGQIDSSALMSQQVDVSVSGAGEARVNAAQTLTARVTGVGSITYLGNPVVTQSVTGLGTISRG
jgi:hypothetical protein